MNRILMIDDDKELCDLIKRSVLQEDNGAGIEKEDLEHIFERLYKCEKGRSKKGSGLGLAIVLQIMEKMGEVFVRRVCLGRGRCLRCAFH